MEKINSELQYSYNQAFKKHIDKESGYSLGFKSPKMIFLLHTLYFRKESALLYPPSQMSP